VYQHVCVNGRSGLASCWGYNVDSQTGDGARTDRSSAFTLPMPDGVEHVAVGYHHSCALLLDGGVACWGDNNHGEVGNGAASDFVVPPARVVGLP
jgi:alpha-tubulin suppressor-like RCC1 family protein